MSLGEGIKRTLPWIEPILDYFDWKKRVVSLVAAIGVGAWSFVKGLPWPVIVTLGFAVLVLTAYALVFPAILRMANVGFRERPDPSIWRHERKFRLFEAACLLADSVPVSNEYNMPASAVAWLTQMCNAINEGDYQRIKSAQDDEQHSFMQKGGTFIYKAHTRREAADNVTAQKIRSGRPTQTANHFNIRELPPRKCRRSGGCYT